MNIGIKNTAATRLVIFALAVIFYIAGPAGAVEYYVSTSGSDNNPGTKERPLATIAAAQDRLRKQRTRSSRPRAATVWVRDGEYHLDKPLTFRPQNSGTEGAEITYAAYPGESVTLKGSQPINATWKPYKNGIYVCSLAGTPLEGKTSDQLFCNDRRMVRARFPDWDFANPLRSGTGYLACEDGDLTQMTWKPGQLDDKNGKWQNPSTGLLHCFHDKNWGNMQYRIKDVDFDTRRIIFGVGGWQCQRRAGPGKGRGHSSPYYIENIFEELGSPHEWFYDEQKGLLYFYPPKGVDIKTAKIEMATLKRLIEFSGTSEEPVHHINIRGFHLTQTQTTFMDAYEDLSRGDWSIHRGGAVYFLGAEDCRVDDCRIEQTGGSGIFLDGYNRRINIAGCLIEDVGESAVCFVGSSGAVRHFMTWADQGREGEKITDLTPGPKSPDYPKDCSVSNSILRNIGVFGKQTSAVIVSKSLNITISHCTVHGIPRAGITFNDGTWGGHILEHCDIWDTVMETGEHGPFNGWGRERFWSGLEKDLVMLDSLETVHIRNNRIANLRPAISAGNWTIDLDDGCSNYHVYNNLSLGSTLKLRDGFFRKVYNNIHVSAVPLGWHCWPEDNGDTFERNITVVAGAPEGSNIPTGEMIKAAGTMSAHPWGKRHAGNLWWNVNTNQFVASNRSGKPVESWQQWRKLGYGEGSALGDPKFVDPANGDYRVKSDSPALKLGFKNFPMDRFGHEMTRIVPFGGQFEDSRIVKLLPDARRGRVHYTLDGSEPTEKSTRYRWLLKITKTTTVRARTFDDGQVVGFEAKATFTKVDRTWVPSWYKCLQAGKWLEPKIETARLTPAKALTEVWHGMNVCNLADDGDLIDASGGQDYGVYISGITPGSPQAKWGFKNADVIIAIGPRKTSNMSDLKAAEQKTAPGKLPVTVMRSYNKVNLTID